MMFQFFNLNLIIVGFEKCLWNPSFFCHRATEKSVLNLAMLILFLKLLLFFATELLQTKTALAA